MARRPFGGTTADFVEQVDNGGLVHADAGATCTFYPTQASGAQITDLEDINGNPISTVSADPYGQIPPFFGPNDLTDSMWVSAGGPNRQQMFATDLHTRVAELETANDVYDFERDFGAPTDGTSSCQTALQTAVNAIVAAGGGRLVLRNRTYNFDSIVWPTVGLDKAVVTIEIVGPFAPNTVSFCPGTGLTLAQGGDMPPPAQGAILKPSMASGAGFGRLSAENNLQPVFRNLIVRCPTNSPWAAIDNGWNTNAVLDGVVVDTGRSAGDGSNPLSAGAIVQPTNTAVEAVVMPGEGNGGVSWVRDVLIAGFYCGLRYSEHFDADRLTLYKNIVGLRPSDGWHAARIGRLSTYWNQIDIQPKNFNSTHPVTRTTIQEWDTEEDPVGGNWYTTTYHLDDPSCLLNIKAPFRRMVPAAGPTTYLLRRGGIYCDLPPMSAQARSRFDAVGFPGANSTTVVPASLNGVAGTQQRGVWGVNGQQLYLATPSGSTAGDGVTWDAGSSQGSVHGRFAIPTNPAHTNCGLQICAIDANNLIFAVIVSGTVQIQKIDTSTYTTLATSAAISPAVTANQSVDMRMTLLGRKLRVYLNGGLMVSYTLSTAEFTKYCAGGTSYGYGAWAYSGTGFEDGTSRWNFLEWESAGLVVA